MAFLRFSLITLAAATILGAASGPGPRPARGGAAEETGSPSGNRNARIMLRIFRSIEQRDPNHENLEQERRLYQPDVEFHWPPSLPYGGDFRGVERTGPTWSDTWNPLQPTAAERRMDPRVLGARGDEVAILYHQRGVDPKGERFDGQVIGLYRLRGGKLARAQMFYFDEAAAVRFLTDSGAYAAR